jgi:hypothetical protein
MTTGRQPGSGRFFSRSDSHDLDSRTVVDHFMHMRIVVAGATDWDCDELAEAIVNRLIARYGPAIVIIHGNEQGVATSFAAAAEELGVSAELRVMVASRCQAWFLVFNCAGRWEALVHFTLQGGAPLLLKPPDHDFAAHDRFLVSVDQRASVLNVTNDLLPGIRAPLPGRSRLRARFAVVLAYQKMRRPEAGRQMQKPETEADPAKPRGNEAHGMAGLGPRQ